MELAPTTRWTRPLNSAAAMLPRVSFDLFGTGLSMLFPRRRTGTMPGRGGGVFAATPMRFIRISSYKTSKSRRDFCIVVWLPVFPP